MSRFMRARAEGLLELECEFLAGLVLRNGVIKTTHLHRLDDTLGPMVAAARELPNRPVRLLDVGCSSGLATVEMHRAFAQAGLPCETVGADLMTTAKYVARTDGCGLLFDAARRVLQVDIGDWAISWKPSRREALLRPLRFAKARWLATVGSRPFRDALIHPSPEFRIVDVSLLSSAAESTPGIRIVEEDILTPQPKGTFDLIRAANVLNRLYFSPSQIVSMTEALCRRLVEGGLLLIARSRELTRTSDGTLFRKAAGRLQTVCTINAGSEVADLVLEEARAPLQPASPDLRRARPGA